MQLQAPEHSTAWFRATYLLMNAMWETDRLSISRSEMASYVGIPDSPPVFAATANTIYAKQLISAGEPETGRQYAKNAASLLLSMPGSALTPRRYSDVIELYQYLGDYKKAQQLIDEAMAHFSDIKKGYIKADLLMAAGHNAFHFKNWQQAFSLYQRSAEAHLEAKSLIGAAVAYANTGRSLQSSEQWSEAEKMLLKSVSLYDQLNQKSELRDKFYVQLRLCEVLLAQSKTEQAQKLFATLNPDSLHTYHRQIYNKLALELTETVSE
ncbi:hypothetical protein [Lacimicrobium alkaliphilum]|uniref:MalT-like TPR region domain-containing protein n=1 Tax=Lacimicrobium alkaliphilum TaxID=1526571 RepID=A0A0U3B0J0_9ALTE|nr:hypothetical protein [Lacimicrobium alkaliphilum]ALS97017.1 hypothetical protein AT746_01135 [Lacimicrobium alkaliphilum]